MFGSGAVNTSALLRPRRRISDKFGEWEGGIFWIHGCSEVRLEGPIQCAMDVVLCYVLSAMFSNI